MTQPVELTLTSLHVNWTSSGSEGSSDNMKLYGSIEIWVAERLIWRIEESGNNEGLIFFEITRQDHNYNFEDDYPEWHSPPQTKIDPTSEYFRMTSDLWDYYDGPFSRNKELGRADTGQMQVNDNNRLVNLNTENKEWGTVGLQFGFSW